MVPLRAMKPAMLFQKSLLVVRRADPADCSSRFAEPDQAFAAPSGCGG